MLISDMDISWLIVYVQQFEEEMLRDRVDYKNKKFKTGNESGKHHLLVHLRQEIEVSTMARIRRNIKLFQRSLEEAWHKEVVGILHMLSVVELTQIIVMIDRQVASSVVKRETS